MFESFQGNNPMDLSDSLDDKNILILHKNIFLTNIIKMNHKTIWRDGLNGPLCPLVRLFHSQPKQIKT